MTGSYTEVQRRAANQIWGAAGHYDFEPMFLAIHSQENRPDFYMNLVIGLAYKYFGEKTLTELLCGGREIAGSRCWMIWPGFI